MTQRGNGPAAHAAANATRRAFISMSWREKCNAKRATFLILVTYYAGCWYDATAHIFYSLSL